MVLRIGTFLFLLLLAGCAGAGYERYGIYDEKRDRIYQHRAAFAGDGGIGMAYTVVYWDVLNGEMKEGERAPEVYYVWFRNNRPLPLDIEPEKLSLYTEKGEKIPLNGLTAKTLSPLRRVALAYGGSTGGYAAFLVPQETMEKDKPSRLVYDDGKGNRVVRYLLIDDMKRYEGLILETAPRYYAPVYPREYWYPYYYPYSYYPYDLRHPLRYWYEPHRHHYYSAPSKPQERQFHTPSPSPKREREDDEEPPGKTRRRQFK